MFAMKRPGKEYGLILPNKKKDNLNLGTRTLNPLVNSDDELERDDEEGALNWVEASLKKSAGNSGQRSLQKRLLREAYEEDSTVFQYDEVYDEMKASQHVEQEKKKQLLQKKPKYIETILKQSEKRKLENERRLERKVQKEREAEGNEFADKESFVTSSYLKKLEELKKAEQEEQREKLMEETLDVHKHKNFGVFYNHIFKQRIGEVEIKQEPEDPEGAAESSTPSTSKKSREQVKNYRTQRDSSDEETPCKLEKSVTVKTEVESSSNEEDDETSEKVDINSKYKTLRKRIRSRETSVENCLDRREGPTDRNKRSRSRGKSRDRSGKDGSRSRSGRDRSRDRRSARDRSRDRSGRDRAKDRSARDRSKDRRGCDRSNARSSRDRSRDRSGRDKSCRDRSEDTNGRGRTLDVHRNRKERSRKENEKNRGHSKERRSRSGSEERSDHRKPAKDGEDKTKESSSKGIKNNQTGNSTKLKQSINTTLGATDINKMKIGDRIKRFTEIFAKKTVGQIYEDAVRRYFQRKSEREANGLM